MGRAGEGREKRGEGGGQGRGGAGGKSREGEAGEIERRTACELRLLMHLFFLESLSLGYHLVRVPHALLGPGCDGLLVEVVRLERLDERAELLRRLTDQLRERIEVHLTRIPPLPSLLQLRLLELGDELRHLGGGEGASPRGEDRLELGERDLAGDVNVERVEEGAQLVEVGRGDGHSWKGRRERGDGGRVQRDWIAGKEGERR